MIQPNELRVGNLVYEEIDAPIPRMDIFVVASINSIYNTLIDEDNKITQVDYCKPIPLTEEWLLRFGFKKNGERDAYPNGYFSFKNLVWELDENFNPCISGRQDEVYYLGNRLQFVHQLQNSVFASTGEELTIKQ